METGDQEQEMARYRHRGQRGKSGAAGGNQTDARWPAWRVGSEGEQLGQRP